MKKQLLSIAVLGVTCMASAAIAAPVKLTQAQMDQVVGGTNPHLYSVTSNPGGVVGAGNSCNNNANCTTTTYKTTGKP